MASTTHEGEDCKKISLKKEEVIAYMNISDMDMNL